VDANNIAFTGLSGAMHYSACPILRRIYFRLKTQGESH
jgi:hypothetical protein